VLGNVVNLRKAIELSSKIITLRYHPKCNEEMNKNSIANSNVGIINEMKKFLNSVAEDPHKRIEYVSSLRDFSRKRLLGFQVMVLLLINSLKRSLSVEIMCFFEHFSPNEICTKQAFSKGRRKLNPKFFHDWNQVLIDSYYRIYQSKFKQWKGMKLFAVDGSSVLLPDTEEMRSKFGISIGSTSGVGSPVARICVLYDVLNQIAVKGFLHPYTVSEEEVTLNLLENLDLAQSLLLFDRGYPSYWLIYKLMEKKTHFVMRAASNANNTVKTFLAGKETDLTLEFYPPYASLKKLRDMGVNISKQTPVKIRLVKVMLNTGEIEVLITNLYDATSYSVESLKEVYHLRWGIETYYGYIKDELQLGQFSGLNSICVEQDFAANLFLFNLQSIIEKQCEPTLKTIGKNRKYQYKVNKNVSWASLKYRVVKLFLVENTFEILFELQKLFCRYLEPIRPNRKYPRKKKRIPNSKHYTITNYKRAI
jgi:hypothetical protein